MPKLEALLESGDYEPYLVFTADSDAVAEPDGKAAPRGRPLYILIDSTWQQARKMVRQSSYLKNIPRVSLDVTAKSQYRLRRNQLDNGMSTCEAAVCLMEQVGEPKNAAALNQYFLDFMRHYDASMSGHGVVE